ncbi:exported hypothetical protein [uncultured Paludibacter sp.]|uniref:Lipocalin-like domain-containing protein n=1 Tax=uncultured Paludibacter sp. TaxID=497635 RepID=A0A653AB64_9BACT|nr:exported hypothetical protein [uncultured Paludibacter sp.]
MKKQIIYLAFILMAAITSFSGCKDDNEEENAKIQYKWTIDKIEFYSKAGTLVHTEDYTDLGVYMTFKADGTFETNAMNDGTITIGMYVYKDDTLTLSYTENGQAQTDETTVLLLNSTNVEIKVLDVNMGEDESGNDITGDMIIYCHH